MTDQEYVRSVWDEPRVLNHTTCCGYDEPFRAEMVEGMRTGWVQTEAEAWSAAAEFTRARLEEVRQLRAEIELIDNCFPSMSLVLTGGEWVREHCEWSRILSRLQAELSRLTAGMKDTQNG